MVKKFTEKDFDDIRKLWNDYYKEEFPFPYLENSFCNAVSFRGEHILGFGSVKRFTEAILMLDKSSSDREKINTLKELIQQAVLVSAIEGSSQLHAFVQDDDFARILIKHFKFQDVIGRALVLSIE